MPVQDPAKLWCLAVGAILCEQNQKRHDEIGGWMAGPDAQGWCDDVLSDSYGVDDEQAFKDMVDWLTRTGHTAEARSQIAGLGPNPLLDYPKQTIVRAYRAQIERQGLLAWDCGRLAAVVGWGYHCHYNDENETWRILHGNAVRIQQTYGSWREFGDAYMMGRMWWAQGGLNPKAKEAYTRLIGDPHSPWNRLPWTQPLGAAPAPSPPGAMAGGMPGKAKVRFKRSVCPSCGGHKTRPSQTAYVYCDFCGTLADYDFAKACESPAKQPGPAYQELNNRLMPMMQQAKATGDVNGYRNLQKQLFEMYIEMLPNANPPRVSDREYRRKYVDYMAEGGTVTAFDPQALALEAEVTRTVTGLQWAFPKPGVMKVAPQSFGAMANAVFAQQDYIAKLYETRGVYAMHPDRPGGDLQKRVGISLFVQGWLPMLDEQSTQAFLDRAGLKTEYVEVEPVKGDKADCASCGTALEILPGAKRCICEKCGQGLEVGGERISCRGCGAPLAPTEGSQNVTCPHCKNSFQRVQMIKPGFG